MAPPLAGSYNQRVVRGYGAGGYWTIVDNI
jgi:hypothetical protein